MIELCLFCKSCWVEFSLPQPRFCSHCGALHNSKGTPAPSVTLPSPAQGDSPEVALTEYEKLRNQNIQRNNEKLESLNLSSMPLKTPTFKNPKRKTPKGTEATMKMALRKLKAIAPHQ
ncbi:unnamed protein product [Sphagnum jensenii]|uniref:Uncharacterized protein n=1 Tax=Sphagnum jensenii TaxID=128206 RepID=A0ABP1BPJ1_9BRYO